MNNEENNGQHPRTDGERRRMSEARFEQLLGEALRVDVPEPRRAGAARLPARSVRRTALLRWGGVAATVLVAVGVTVNSLRDSAYISSGDLAADVMIHVDHEPDALARTDATVSEEAIAGVLRAAGASMSRFDAPVSYVKLCPFRGEMVAHFAVQTPSGTITVLLLPNEEVSAPIQVSEAGFVGTIAPLSIGGSIAVVGQSGEKIEDIQKRVAEAVSWRL